MDLAVLTLQLLLVVFFTWGGLVSAFYILDEARNSRAGRAKPFNHIAVDDARRAGSIA